MAAHNAVRANRSQAARNRGSLGSAGRKRLNWGTPRQKAILRRTVARCALLAGVASALTARGAADTWTGDVDSSWAQTTSPTNWNPSGVPAAATDTALFDGSSSTVSGHTTIDLGSGGQSILNLTFDSSSAAAYTIGAGAVGSQLLTLTGNDSTTPVTSSIIMTGSVANNQTVNAKIYLGATTTSSAFDFLNDSTAASLTFGGPITYTAASGNRTLVLGGIGSGSVSGKISEPDGTIEVSKTGTGTWDLSPASGVTDSFTSNTSALVSNGTLELDYSLGGTALSPTASSLGAYGGTFYFVGKSSGGTTINLYDTGTVANQLTTQSFVLASNSGVNQFIVNGNGGSGTTVNTGSFATHGGGALIFDETANSGGAINTPLVNNADGFIGPNIFFRNASGIDFASTTNTAGSSGPVAALGAMAQLPASGSVSSTCYALNDSQTVSTESIGNLRITNDQAGQSLTVGSGLTLTVGASIGSSILFVGSYPYTIAGAGTIDEASTGNDGVLITNFGTGTLTINAHLNNSSAGQTNFMGNGGLTDWAGSTTLTPTAATNGDYIIAGQTVRLSNSTNTSDGGSAGTAGAINLGNYGSGSASFFASTGNISIATGGILELSTANLTRDLGTGAGQIQIYNSGGFSAYSTNTGSPVSRSVSLGIFGGSNPAALVWGNSSTTTGTTGFVPDGGNLILGSPYSNATLNFQNSIDLNGENRVIQVYNGVNANDIDGSLNGQIIDSTGFGGMLTKTGPGELALAYAGGNTYTGGTMVSAGTLLISNTSNSATGTGPLWVARGAAIGGTGISSGSSFAIGGSGSSGVATVVAGNGTDATSSLTLTASGASTIANTNLAANLDSASTNSNQLAVGNTPITFGGNDTVLLSVLGSNPIPAGTLYTLIVGTGSGSGLNGSQYSGLTSQGTDGSGNTIISGINFAFTDPSLANAYAESFLVLSQNGEDIDFEVATPEPASIGMLAVLGMGLLGRRRRRTLGLRRERCRT